MYVIEKDGEYEVQKNTFIPINKKYKVDMPQCSYDKVTYAKNLNIKKHFSISSNHWLIIDKQNVKSIKNAIEYCAWMTLWHNCTVMKTIQNADIIKDIYLRKCKYMIASYALSVKKIKMYIKYAHIKCKFMYIKYKFM